MASMVVEAIAVIKKNSKNNNTKGCAKVTGEVTAAHPFCDMLLSVGKGIAMGNASEKVKAIAADICKSVADDGINFCHDRLFFFLYLSGKKVIYKIFIYVLTFNYC